MIDIISILSIFISSYVCYKAGQASVKNPNKFYIPAFYDSKYKESGLLLTNNEPYRSSEITISNNTMTSEATEEYNKSIDRLFEKYRFEIENQIKLDLSNGEKQSAYDIHNTYLKDKEILIPRLIEHFSKKYQVKFIKSCGGTRYNHRFIIFGWAK